MFLHISKDTTDMEFSFIAPGMHKRLQREVFCSQNISSLENTLLKFGKIGLFNLVLNLMF